MAQWLKALITCVEDPRLTFGTHNFGPGNLCRHPGTHVAHRHQAKPIYINLKQNYILKNGVVLGYFFTERLDTGLSSLG